MILVNLPLVVVERISPWRSWVSEHRPFHQLTSTGSHVSYLCKQKVEYLGYFVWVMIFQSVVRWWCWYAAVLNLIGCALYALLVLCCFHGLFDQRKGAGFDLGNFRMFDHIVSGLMLVAGCSLDRRGLAGSWHFFAFTRVAIGNYWGTAMASLNCFGHKYCLCPCFCQDHPGSDAACASGWLRSLEYVVAVCYAVCLVVYYDFQKWPEAQEETTPFWARRLNLHL